MAETKKPTIIAIANYEYSSAKTTTASELAYLFGAVGGRRVLAIDMSDSGDLTIWLHAAFPDAPNPGIGDVLLADENGNRMPLADAVVHTGIENVDAVPSTSRHPLYSMMVKAEEAEDGFETRLKTALEVLIASPDHPSYDYIIIDCAPDQPSLIANAVNAVAAGGPASRVIIPTAGSGWSRKSIKLICRHIEAAAGEDHTDKIPVAILWTKVDESNGFEIRISKRRIEELSSEFEGIPQFDTRIKRINPEPMHDAFFIEPRSTGRLGRLHVMHFDLAYEIDPDNPEWALPEPE